MRKALKHLAIILAAAALCLSALSPDVRAQETASQRRDGQRADGKLPRGVRVVTIPITIRRKGKKVQEEELTPVDFTVREDGELQHILSLRSIESTPLSVAVLIQDDLPSIGNEIKGLAEFIRRLPRGSRVLIGYIKTGTLEVRQKFTTDLERAANALRIPVGFPTAAPYNPYVEISEALRRFEALPAGRRAMIVVSDGLDLSHGADISSVTHSPDQQHAINLAQRFGVAIYSLYSPSASLASANNNTLLISGAQGALARLSDETGGRAFFQGTSAPVSFDPFLRDINVDLIGQLALSYLSTHPKKGYHRIEITSGNHEVEIDHPAGYMR